MLVPNLDPVARKREYNSYTEKQRDMVVYSSLFVKGMSNRNIDKKLLGLDPDKSKGWQSMGILHHLGLKKTHKGIFIGYSIDAAINILVQQDSTHFKNIIDVLLRLKQKGEIPKVFDSWELLGNKVALKTIDKSTFIHFGTSIPVGIRGFFEIDSLIIRDKKTIYLIHNNVSYIAKIEMGTLHNNRSRLFWKADFRDLLKNVMPTYYNLLVNDAALNEKELPKIRFSKVDDTHFYIEFIYPSEIEADIKEEIEEDNFHTTDTVPSEGEPKHRKEGKVNYVYGKKYERDPQNRVEAIKYHGTKCAVCGFDFEKVYGARGKGYIEIHHVNPLSSVGKETDINPKTDLIPVCSNCHKMIHRKKDKVLSIDEMKQLINKK